MNKKLNINSQVIRLLLGSVVLLMPATGCKKYLNDVPLPTNLIAAKGVFIDDASVSSVVTGIFYDMGSGTDGLTLNASTGLYTDELTYFNTAPLLDFVPLYTDNITGVNGVNGPRIWTTFYAHIYECNLAIEGINGSRALLVNRNQYLGEAYVARAWLYFNLVNLYGGVPLAITSDYKTNNTLSRSTPAQVYAQIIADAKMAASLLPVDFRTGAGATTTTSRARPNKYMAEAILARAYLYNNDWVNAEAQATDIVNNTTLFKLTAPAQTFNVSGNTEAIWYLINPEIFVWDYEYYNGGMPAVIPVGSNILNYSLGVCMSDAQRNVFDNNDLRLANWVRSTLDLNSNTTYYFPNKYKSPNAGVEAEMVVRLAEIYLIRAEARAEQNNVSGAQADINVIRTRAGLSNTTAATQSNLLLAVVKERRCELFSESGSGHRFYDLKRTGKIDSVMNIEAPLKSGTWASFKQLWPISPSDVLLDPNLVQNPGYH